MRGLSLFLCLGAGLLNAQQVSLQSGAWTIIADQARAELTITHAAVGVVMRNVRLNSGRGRWLLPKTAGNRITILTEQPRTAWEFEVDRNTLKISTTEAGALATATVPAGADRVVARLLDPQGPPVDWTLTAEVAHGYGGSETHNPSFLPRRNADVMYFSLGNVSSPLFRGLFDRGTDTAIDFGDSSVLERSAKDRESLNARIRVQGSAVVRVVPDYFTKTLGLPYYAKFDDSHFPTAPMVWSSWTSYYEAVREDDIVRNAEWLAAHLKPYGFQYVQLDDGYDRDERGQHRWIENWDRRKFPHGPEWLTAFIRSKGLRAGIWLVPNAYAGAVERRPDWYVRDKQGRMLLDYATPTLDSSHPDALAQVVHILDTLDKWGFDYYKFDGEHAFPKYVPAVDRAKLYDKNPDLLALYRHRLEAIRKTIGPDRFIEGCPAGTPLNGIGYFNSYFTGDDLYNNWQGMYPLFSSINANAFLNHLAVYVMPGEGIELGLPMTVEEALRKRPKVVVDTARTREDPMIGFGVSDAEARTVVTYVALTGVAYPLASVMPELPEQRIKLLKATMPTMPVMPADLFSRGTDMTWDKFKHTQPDFYIHNYPEILDLKVNAASGVYDVVGFTNWRSRKTTRQIDLREKLGLESNRRYVAFDFWNQRVLGVFENRLDIEIDPHDTRVILLHPTLDRPQLVGNSRHISGAKSVLAVSWDAASNTLRGSAESVPGDPYTLWVYVPGGANPSAVHVKLRGGSEVAAERSLSGNAMSVTFPGQAQPVDWEITFTRAAGN